MCTYITTITVTVEQHGTMIVLFHRTMEAATLWLEGLLDSYVKPNPQDADYHQSILDLRMQEMTERLPEINRVFEQSWKMSNLLHGPISTNQILPQGKRVNRDIVGTSNLQNRTYGFFL